MLNFIKKGALLLLVAFVMAGVAGCKKSNGNSIYVGTNAEFQPFEYLDNGVITGFDIELIQEVGKLIGKEVVIKNMAFDGLLPALQAKKIDMIVSGMTETDERKKSVNFSTPYFTSKQAILVNNDTDIIKSFDDLKGHNIGVVLGYTGDIIVTGIEGVKIQRYNATSESIMALKAKKVDAVVLDSEPAKNYVKYNESLKLIDTDLAEEDYAMAISKENTELLKSVNDALATLRANGTYDKLIAKYF